MMGIAFCPVVGGECNKIDPENSVEEDTFFLAEPFEPKKERENREFAVTNALKEVLGECFSEQSLRFADKDPSEPSFFCDICREIQSSAYGIVDVTGKRPNVLIELGMMFSLGKPVFVIAKKDEEEELKRSLPSDILWKWVVFYKDLIEVQKELPRYLKNRPLVKAEPPTGKLAREALSELVPQFSEKVDERIDDIVEELRRLMEVAKLGETVPSEKRIEIPPQLERKIDALNARLERAEKVWDRPYSPRTAFLRGTWHFHSKDYRKAVKSFDWVLDADPNDAMAWHNKGLSLGRLGEYDEAIKCLDKAIELKPDFSDAWHNRGVCTNRLGKSEDSIEYFDRAIELDPDSEKSWSSMGAALTSLGRWEEARTYYEKALELNPNYANALENLSEAHLFLGDYDKGLELAERALNAEPAEGKTIPRFLRLCAHSLKGDRERANEEIERFLEYHKEAAEWPGTSTWEFSAVLPTLEKNLDGENLAKLLLVVSFLEGEIPLEELEGRISSP